jgi:hypothetical protein
MERDRAVPELDVTEAEKHMGNHIANEFQELVFGKAGIHAFVSKMAAELECRERQLSEVITERDRQYEHARVAKEWAATWHKVVETALTINGLSPALGADEATVALSESMAAAKAERDILREQVRVLTINCGNQDAYIRKIQKPSMDEESDAVDGLKNKLRLTESQLSDVISERDRMRRYIAVLNDNVSRGVDQANRAADAFISVRNRAEAAEAQLSSLPEWLCFHCEFATSDSKEAANHFGDLDDGEPICQTWKVLNADEKLQEYQSIMGELNAERDENAKLSTQLSGITLIRDAWKARADIAELRLSAYNTSGFSDADTMASAYLDSQNALVAAGAQLSSLQSQEAPADAWHRGWDDGWYSCLNAHPSYYPKPYVAPPIAGEKL